jgi:hypothetical protein
MMYRLLHLTLFAILVAMWPGNVGQAFTLQLAPLSPAEATTPVSATADLPTPQLFRVALDARGLTLGVWPPAVGFQAPKIDVYRQDVPVPSPPQPVVMPDAQRTASSRLRGVEVLLLRQTETVAGGESSK